MGAGTGLHAILLAASTLAAADLRIGYSDYAPLGFTSSDGKPAGLLIDVLTEAARRRKLRIRFVEVPQGVDYGLRSGLIDIWPAAAVTEPRRTEFHISEPWWSSEMVFLTHRESGFYKWEDLSGRPIAVQTNPHIRQRLQQALGPSFNLLPVDTAQAAAVFCSRTAEALLLESVAAQRFLLNRPAPCRDARLAVVAWPEGVLPLALMSAPAHARAVAELRQGIQELTADGGLIRIAERWPPVNVRTAESLMTGLRLRQQRYFYIAALSAAAVILGVGVAFVVRLRREIGHRRRTEAALARQAAELAQSNEHLEQFAYASAHDLQEPLRNISLSSQMLRRKYAGTLDGDADTCLNFIVTGVGRMQSMISDLLAYSRAGERESAAGSAIDATLVLRKVMQNLESTLTASGAAVKHSELPSVSIDETHLMQLFQNLVVNAVNYRSDSPPKVNVSATRNGDSWIFSVADNGIGIDPQYQEKIFGVFRRLHGQEVPGTGMGLAICRRILARYGGRIWVESERGKGATFRFTLPAG